MLLSYVGRVARLFPRLVEGGLHAKPGERYEFSEEDARAALSLGLFRDPNPLAPEPIDPEPIDDSDDE